MNGEESINILINEVKELKTVINNQNKSIELILSENKALKEEVKKITKIIEATKPKKSYYADLNRWIPIMKNYAERKPW